MNNDELISYLDSLQEIDEKGSVDVTVDMRDVVNELNNRMLERTNHKVVGGFSQ
ncbi:hypothetical protein [Virgibacillus sp. CBA3643]|uniref:hypothetical protein n=1 Tax=Virgibacillus sp. CBA3643 TaxID=2942278 RepID=UPI0035A2AB11